MRDPLDSGSDERLMRATRRGDMDALGQLFERHHAEVYAYCARITMDRDAAADLLQETFKRVLRYRRSFGAGSRFRPWLFRVARNACRDHFGRTRRRSAAEGAWMRDGAAVAAGPDELGANAGLERALARLSTDDRELLVLKRLHQMSYPELARVLGCSEGAARVRVHRAFHRLRRICEERSGLRT